MSGRGNRNVDERVIPYQLRELRGYRVDSRRRHLDRVIDAPDPASADRER